MATGLRKLIYIPNEEIWQGIQIAAKGANRSVSNFLVTLYQDSVRAGDSKDEGNKPAQPDKFESHRPVTHDTKKKVKKIIEEVPGVQSASNVFNPQPKGKE